MALHPTSSIHFCDRGGNSIDGPEEWVPALIKVYGVQENWTEVRLIRQGNENLQVSLRLLKGEIQVVADWPVSPIGHYRLELSIGRKKTDERTITILPKKITPEASTQLVEDLEMRLPTAIALGLKRNAALAGMQFLPPGDSTLAQELARLRLAVNGNTHRVGLTHILSNLARDPHQVLKTIELWMPREQARRPHPSRLVQAISRFHNVDTSGLPIRVLDTRVEHSKDVYENCLVEVYFRQVNLRLHRLVQMLDTKTRSTSTKGHLIEAERLRDELGKARLQAMFLDEVTIPSYLPTQITMVLLRHPLYRAALEGYLDLHKSPTVRLEEPALEAPLENLPFLYQVWCTLEVINILLEITGTLGYRVERQQLAKKDVYGVFIKLLPDGEPAIVLEHPIHKTVIKVIPERLYSRRRSDSHQEIFHSISFEQCPDIAVEILPPEASPRIYLFDPKYKLENEQYEEGKGNGKPKKEDIDKMHAYRDAIRGEEQRSVVQYAAIMYPGIYQSYNEGIEALQAYPGLEGLLEDRLREILLASLRT